MGVFKSSFNAKGIKLLSGTDFKPFLSPTLPNGGMANHIVKKLFKTLHGISLIVLKQIWVQLRQEDVSKINPRVPKDIYLSKICRPKGIYIFDLENQGLEDGKSMTLVRPDSKGNAPYCTPFKSTLRDDYECFKSRYSEVKKQWTT